MNDDDQTYDPPEFLPADTEIIPYDEDDLATVQETALPAEDEDPTLQTSAIDHR